MYPDFNRFKYLASKFRLVPTYLEMPADLETPVTVYLKVAAQKPFSALLESVEGSGKMARHSFITISHHFRFESYSDSFAIWDRLNTKIDNSTLNEENPMDPLRKLLKDYPAAQIPELPRFCGGAVGVVSYDMVRHFEKIPNLLREDSLKFESLFLLTDECIVFDHWKHKLYIVKWNLICKSDEKSLKKVYASSLKSLKNIEKEIESKNIENLNRRGTKPSVAKIQSNFNKAKFKKAVLKCKEYIRSGDVIQTVLSQRFETVLDVDPFHVYRALRMVNPSPYLYFFKLNDLLIAGSSPEILVRKEGSLATVRPIAGTRRRGRTTQEDQFFEKELLGDEKERAEHLMLVDLGRNDLGRCCRNATVKVEDFMSVEHYSHVMHLVSTVTGELQKKMDAFALFKACFPAGTVTGAPKIRAMEIIEELENVRRSLYAGSVGYFSYTGDMDMAITIRTLLFKDKKIYMQAGAGIVADSDPKREEKETRSKAAALFKAIELARSGL